MVKQLLRNLRNSHPHIFYILFTTVVFSSQLLVWGYAAASQKTLEESQVSPVKIISFNMSGGEQVLSVKEKPLLEIFSTGKILARSMMQSIQPVTHSMSQNELTNLLEYIVSENSFYEIDSDVIKNEIAHVKILTNRLFRVSDAQLTSVTVTIPGRTKTIQFYALAQSARQYPTIKKLQQLANIQKKLLRIVESTGTAR